MAFFEDDETKKKESSSPFKSALGGGSAQGAPGQAQESKPKGSGWTNLSRYLDANSNAGATMGEQVKSDVKPVFDDAKERIPDGADYGKDLDLSNPLTVSQADYNTWVTPTYTEDEGQKAKVDDVVNNTDSHAGRTSLLNKSFGDTGDYTNSMKNFDSFLLGQAGGEGSMTTIKDWGRDYDDQVTAKKEDVAEIGNHRRGEAAKKVDQMKADLERLEAPYEPPRGSILDGVLGAPDAGSTGTTAGNVVEKRRLIDEQKARIAALEALMGGV